MSASTVAVPRPPATAHRPGWILAAVSTAIFMLMLDLTITSAAMADIQRDLNASLTDLQWVIDAYALPIAGLLLTAATLGDRIGRRRLYLAGMAVFTVASAGAALAGSALALNLTRAAQGVGAVLLFGVGLPLIAQAYPDLRRRAGAIGIFGAVLGGGTAVGPLVGGALVDGPGWRWIFLINVPVGLAALVLAARVLPRGAGSGGTRADWAGTVLLSAGLVAGVLALIRGNEDGWTSVRVLGLAAASLLLIAAFGWWQARASYPMLDLELLRRPSFVAIAVMAFGLSASVVASTTYIALYFVNTLGLSPFQTGLRFLPLTGASFLAAPVAARLSHRFAPRVLAPVGSALIAAGMWLMTGLDGASEWTALLPGSVVAGIGLGVTSAVLSQAALSAVEPERAGMATGAANTFRQIGIAAGVAALGAVFAHSTTGDVETRLSEAGLPADAVTQLAGAVGNGAGVRVADSVPGPVAQAVATAAREATAAGLDQVLWIGTAVAVLATVVAVVLTALDRG